MHVKYVYCLIGSIFLLPQSPKMKAIRVKMSTCSLQAWGKLYSLTRWNVPHYKLNHSLFPWCFVCLVRYIPREWRDGEQSTKHQPEIITGTARWQLRTKPHPNHFRMTSVSPQHIYTKTLHDSFVISWWGESLVIFMQLHNSSNVAAIRTVFCEHSGRCHNKGTIIFSRNNVNVFSGIELIFKLK